MCLFSENPFLFTGNMLCALWKIELDKNIYKNRARPSQYLYIQIYANVGYMYLFGFPFGVVFLSEFLMKGISAPASYLNNVQTNAYFF